MSTAGGAEVPPSFVTEPHGIPRSAWNETPPDVVLVVAHSGLTPNGNQRHPLPSSGLTVGRDPATGLRIPDARVSRDHFRVRRVAPAWEVTDLGSRNGTWVNGRRIAAPARVELGDVIRAGSSLFMLALSSPGAASGAALGLVGSSAALHAVRDSIGRVAGTDASVLILGETGVGKELVARAVHQSSGRTGAFLAVNCGAIAEPLLESELFGHVRGAFTGAVSDRPGLFRSAHGGTLFLDEVGEMPAALQVKLLRALETRTVRPIGTWQEFPVDVRVVAATHRDLTSEIQAQRFRVDLYARISQWLIQVPPLRERREDIPLLVRALLERHHAGDRPVDADLMETLLRASWSLNVRGLANVISTAVLACTPGQAVQLRPPVVGMLESAEKLAAAPGPEPSEERETPPTSDEVRAALEAAHGNVAAAARDLRCTRQQLYRLCQVHGLDPQSYRRHPTPR